MPKRATALMVAVASACLVAPAPSMAGSKGSCSASSQAVGSGAVRIVARCDLPAGATSGSWKSIDVYGNAAIRPSKHASVGSKRNGLRCKRDEVDYAAGFASCRGSRFERQTVRITLRVDGSACAARFKVNWHGSGCKGGSGDRCKGVGIRAQETVKPPAGC